MKIQKYFTLGGISEFNIQKVCKAVSEITEEDFESFDSNSRKLLQNLISQICDYLKSSGILESYQLRKQLKALSAEISTYSQQILIAHPVPCTFDEKYSNLTYQELETLAKKQQIQIKSAQSSQYPLKKVLKSRSSYIYHHLNLLKSPNFSLMLFEYSDGIPSFYPHEDKQIEIHKKKISQEIDGQLDMLVQKYGQGSIKKIIKSRKMWDLDYCNAFHDMRKKVRRLKKFSAEVLDDSDVFLKSQGLRFDQFQAYGMDFYEGPVEFCVVAQICNMDLCAVKNPVVWNKRVTPNYDLEATINVYFDF